MIQFLKYRVKYPVNLFNRGHHGSDNIYPNPVKDVLTVEYALLANTNLNSISIYNLQGKLVKSVNISEPIGIREINLTDLNEGMYILSFGKDGVKTYSKKFTIKK
jgi:hypothetical protein